MGDKPLTAAQERFCIEVVKTSNQSEAYRIAFPPCKKWKVDSVWQAASTLCAEPKIRDRIAQLKDQIVTAPGVASAEECARTLTLIMRGDLRQLVDENWRLKKPSDIPNEHAIALVGVKFDKHGNPEVRIADKERAAIALLAMHGKTEQPDPDTIADANAIEGALTSHDLARRIAFTLTQSARNKQLPEPSSS